MSYHYKIAVLGAGNIGSSLIRGLLKHQFPANQIAATLRKKENLGHLSELGIITTTDNVEAIRGALVIVIAVKPFKIDILLDEIKKALKDGQVLVSVVSGISVKHIRARLGLQNITICRAMPNTAIAIGESMTCVAAPHANDTEREMIIQVFSGLGKAIFINEEMMDAATVLAACGIAFAMRFIRAMMQAGIEIGFSSDTAKFIVNQTVKGAAELLIQNQLHPEQEIDKVTTPKGYTISGLNEMEHNGFSSALIKGIVNSYSKIEKANLV